MSAAKGVYPEADMMKSMPKLNFQGAAVSSVMTDYNWIKWDNDCTRKPLVCMKSADGVVRFEYRR